MECFPNVVPNSVMSGLEGAAIGPTELVAERGRPGGSRAHQDINHTYTLTLDVCLEDLRCHVSISSFLLARVTIGRR
jgi:hypothetical protein